MRSLYKYYPELELDRLPSYDILAWRHEEPATPESLYYASALGRACSTTTGYIDIVRWLLPFPGMNDEQAVALGVALVKGHLDIAKLLIETFEYTQDDIYGVVSALERYYEYGYPYRKNVGQTIKFLQSYPQVLPMVLFALSSGNRYVLPLVQYFDRVEVLQQFLDTIPLYQAQWNGTEEESKPLIEAIHRRIGELSE